MATFVDRGFKLRKEDGVEGVNGVCGVADRGEPSESDSCRSDNVRFVAISTKARRRNFL